MEDPFLQALSQHINPQILLTGESVRARFSHVWETDKALQAKAVVLPRTTEEISAILKLCHQYQQPVVVHGGLTNLVGGTETQGHELVISMENMNAIEEVDAQSRTMTVQAGVILEHAHEAAQAAGLLLPLSFGAKGSAQIGGVIATNAGGLRVFRFGMTRHLVLGLEVVLADGTIINSLKKILKDNSAYDIKQWFIGSEGTLGVITRAVFKLVEAPRSRNSAFVGLQHYEQVVELLRFMDQGLAGTLSGFELMWQASYQAMTSPPATVSPPLPQSYPYYVLLESLGSDQEADYQRLLTLLETALERNIIRDAALASSGSELARIWKIREEVEVMVGQCQHVQHFDISLPIPHMGQYVEDLLERMMSIPAVEKVFPFGHVADGNIHLIIGKREQSQALIRQINDCVYGPLPALGGSVSAEHGIGLHKKPYLALSRSQEERQLMRLVKQALDPLGILNPGKVLD